MTVITEFPTYMAPVLDHEAMYQLVTSEPLTVFSITYLQFQAHRQWLRKYRNLGGCRSFPVPGGVLIRYTVPKPRKPRKSNTGDMKVITESTT